LDEPTHHLDIPSKEALKDAIKSYNGTVIIVSHDREFLRGLAEKTVFFANRGIRVYEGDIDYFLEKMDSEDILHSFQNAAAPPATNAQTKPQMSVDAQKTLQKKLKQIEKQIETIESQIKEVEAKMAESDFFGSKGSDEILQSYKQNKLDLNRLHEEWETVVDSLG